MPIAPPSKRTVSEATTVRAPWLKALEDNAARLGLKHNYTDIDVSAGATIYEDQANKLLGITDADGDVVIWSGHSMLRIWAKEPAWRLKWFFPEKKGHETAVFSIGKADDYAMETDEVIAATGFDIDTEDFEGKEALFAEFVKLVAHSPANPVPFPLLNGTYRSGNSGVTFRIDFGWDSAKPSIKPVDSSLPPVLEFPFRTALAVFVPIEVGGQALPDGSYIAEASIRNAPDGPVTMLKLRNTDTDVRTQVAAQDMIVHLKAGEVEIVRIMQDHKPSF